MTHRGGPGSIGWLADHCCPQLSFDLSERRRRQNDANIQDMLKLSNMLPYAKSFECQLKIRHIPINHLRFVKVHQQHMPILKEEHHNNLM